MKVLVSLEIPEIGIDMLKSEGLDVTVWRNELPMTIPELIDECQKFDALLSMSTYKLDAGFLQACKHLKIISQFSVGYDNIDLAEATRLGIPFGNAPDAMTDATADIAFGLMLAVSRKLFYMHKKIAAGKWGHFVPKANLGLEPKNKTVGILGLGRIGTEFAKRCKGAYDMTVLYHNRSRNEEAEKLLDATYVSFEELLNKSDIISTHCALNNDTREIFNSEAFKKMKNTAVFLNTARGGIHNEIDLIKALEQNEIWGAGLDVTNPEPMRSDNPLLFMENVAVTPHIGSATIKARDEMARLAAMNIIAFSKGEEIPNLINPSVFS